jgi:glycosyltransferase involved in cell wall biosynthesis
MLLTNHSKEEIAQLAEKSGVAQNDFSVFMLSHDEVFRHLMMCDVGILIRENSLINKVASPIKFGEYISCNIPVLATDNIGDTGTFIREYNVGSLIKDMSNKHEIYSAIDRIMILASSNRKELVHRCQQLIEDHLNNDRYIKVYINIYNKLSSL